MYMILKRKNEWVDYGRLVPGDPELYMFAETDERLCEILSWFCDEKLCSEDFKDAKMVKVDTWHSETTLFVIKLA